MVAGLLIGCPGDDGGGGGTAGDTAPSSASNEDGPEPQTCEQIGGVCDCVGSCGMGLMASPEGTCPQAPDEAGACSMECCVPVGDDTGSGTDSAGGPANIDECILESAIDVECTDPDVAFAYVVFSEQLGCTGSSGATDKQALLLTSLRLTPPGGDPPVLGLRIADPMAPLPDNQVELTLPESVPYGLLDPTMMGSLVFTPGLPLVFVDATGSGTAVLDSVPTLEALTAGGELLEGTFQMSGAAVNVPEPPELLDDPSFELRGCFRLPADLYPIELD